MMPRKLYELTKTNVLYEIISYHTELLTHCGASVNVPDQNNRPNHKLLKNNYALTQAGGTAYAERAASAEYLVEKCFPRLLIDPLICHLRLWNARLFLYQLRSDRTGTRGVFDGPREEAYSGADREPVAAG
jgi:hypothetical protein